ncbi:hypothetical protein M569_07154, partial [Genlisea aurea]
SFPQNHFQQFLQPQQQQQPQQSKPFSDLYSNNMEPVTSYFNTPNLLDRHAPYIPPYEVAGVTREEDGLDLQWNFGVGVKKKRPTEQVFLENNNYNSNNTSQISSAELFQPRSVSTGLGLSLENPLLTSSGDSGLMGLEGDTLEQELRRQDAEIDRYLKLQGDRLRQAILDKFRATQLQTISYIEEKVIQKLRSKESVISDMNRKNSELESQVDRLATEANVWQQRAKHSDNMINTLKLNIQQLQQQQQHHGEEGCGDSEDTASCCNGSLLLLGGGNNNNEKGTTTTMMCKGCGVNRVSMLLFPCKHLCLCRGCESRLSVCPVCQSWKYIGMEVYM